MLQSLNIKDLLILELFGIVSYLVKSPAALGTATGIFLPIWTEYT